MSPLLIAKMRWDDGCFMVLARDGFIGSLLTVERIVLGRMTNRQDHYHHRSRGCHEHVVQRENSGRGEKGRVLGDGRTQEIRRGPLCGNGCEHCVLLSV